MTKWTIRGRIAASFAIILALMMVTAGVAYTQLIRIEELSGDIGADSLPGLNCSSRILVDGIANYSLTEQYALQTDVAIKRKLKAAILASRDHTATLFAQYDDDNQDARRPTSVRVVQARAGPVSGSAGRTSGDRPGPEGPRRSGQSDRRRISIRNSRPRRRLAEAVVDHNKAAADESTRLITQAVTQAKAGVLLSVGVGLVVAFCFGFTPAPGDYPAAWPVGRHPGCDAHGRSVRPAQPRTQ